MVVRHCGWEEFHVEEGAPTGGDGSPDVASTWGLVVAWTSQREAYLAGMSTGGGQMDTLTLYSLLSIFD